MLATLRWEGPGPVGSDMVFTSAGRTVYRDVEQIGLNLRLGAFAFVGSMNAMSGIVGFPAD